MKKYLIVFICIILPGIILSNDRNSLYQYTVDQKDGLSNSAVLSFYQDNTGLMWIGTYDGLNCYDGFSMETFRTDFSSDTTFLNNVINDLCYAGNHNLWVYSDKGASLMSMDKRKVIANFPFAEKYKLYSNSQGNTWALGLHYIYYYNESYKKFIKVAKNEGFDPDDSSAHVSHEGVFTIVGGDKPYSLICTLSSFSADTLSVMHKTFHEKIHNFPIVKSFGQNGICCFFDIKNDLYVLDLTRKSKLFITNLASLEEKFGSITGIVPYYDDYIVFFHSQSIVRLNASKQYAVEVLKRHVRVFCTYVDTARGILWIGTDGQGVLRISRNNGIINNILLRDISEKITGQARGILTDSDGTLWIGTKGDGLLRIPDYNSGIDNGKIDIYTCGKKTPVYQFERKNSFYPVFCLKNSSFFKGFWVGMSDSILYYYSKNEDMIKPLNQALSDKPFEVHGLYEQSDSVLWVATIGAGLFKVDLAYTSHGPLVKQYKQFHFSDSQEELINLSSVCAYRDSILFLGSRGNGLVCLDMHKESYRVFSLQDILHRSVDDVLSLYLDESKSVLYVGTTAGLLAIHLLEKSRKPIYLGGEDGLFNDMIHGIVQDQSGILWLGTNKGLVRFNPETVEFYTYLSNNGVEVVEFSDDSYYKCPYSNSVFLGGVNGLLSINSNIPEAHDYYPDIILRSITVENVKSYWTQYYETDKAALVLLEDKHTFSVEFIVPDYSVNTIEYSYLLEGYDKRWSEFSKQNKADFTDLPPGNYTLKIKYKKGLTDSDSRVFEIPVLVSGNWYSKYLAYFAFFIIALLAGYVLLKLNKHDLLRDVLTLGRRPREKADREKAPQDVEAIEKDNSNEAFLSASEILIGKLGEDMKEVILADNPDKTAFLLKIINLIEENLEKESLNISFLAEQSNVSTRQFYRKYNECISVSPIELIKHIKMNRAKELVCTTDLSIQEIIEKVGIQSRSYFYKEFTQRFGLTPGALRDSVVANHDMSR